MDFKKHVSLWALILANTIPLVGCFFWDWDAKLIVLYFWIENLIIGGYNVLKMLFLPSATSRDRKRKIFMTVFFLIHYSGFCAAHGLFLSEFALQATPGESSLSEERMGQAVLWGPLVFLGLIYQLVIQIVPFLPGASFLGIIALVISHGVSWINHYWIKNERATLKLRQLMVQPYRRIVLLHIVIILGSLPIVALGSPMPLLVLLVLGKTVLDAILHRREHAKNK
ncbi:MAG: DUF6498-containing protein [Verrucomicrobiota bacterium]